MKARSVRKAALALSITLMIATPCVPYVYHWLHPLKLASPGPGLDGAISVGFGLLLGIIGHSVAIALLMMAFAVATIVASLTALIAAWVGRESRGVKWLCATPMLMLAAVWVFAALDGL